MPIEDFVKHTCKGPVVGVVEVGGKLLEVRTPIKGNVNLKKTGWTDEKVPLNLAAGHKKCANCGLDVTDPKNVEPITRAEWKMLSGGHKEAQ
jgi:hypothetical protein